MPQSELKSDAPDQTILTEKSDGVVTLTLNAPEKLNALSPTMLREFLKNLETIAEDKTARALIVTGAGRAFCAGADLSDLGGGVNTPEERAAAVRHSMLNGFNPVIRALSELPIPTIAAVNGVAAGGGYGVALACDLVVAAETATFILLFTPQLGLIPDLGASWHAPRLLGRARAMAAAFFGERMSAGEAAEKGLIWRCEPNENLMKFVESTAEQLAQGPTLAYPEVRRAFDAAFSNSLSEQLDYEADRQPRLIATDDHVEGVVAFLKKRKPAFKGC